MRIDAGLRDQAVALVGAAHEHLAAVLERVQQLHVAQAALVDLLMAAELLPPPTPDPDPEPEPEPEPPAPAPDPYAPPPRARLVEGAPAGTTVQPGTFYLNPQGVLRFPDYCREVTVVGLERMPGYVKGWRDVYVAGTPERPMEIGPLVDVDGLQIKAGDGIVPEDLTFRHFLIHDISRTGSKHTDGVQVMAGRRIAFVDGRAVNVAVQPFFVRDAGPTAGGGPIEDITFERVTATRTGGVYAFRISGDDEVGVSGRYVPTRVRIIDCAGDKGVAMDAAARARGGEILGYRMV